MNLQKVQLEKIENDKVIDVFFQIPCNDSISETAMQINIINYNQNLDTIDVLIEPIHAKYIIKQIEK